jgi:hypothetical protein
MLSFKHGKDIALIKGGEYDNQILKLDLEGEDKRKLKLNYPAEVLGNKFFLEHKIGKKDINDFMDAIIDQDYEDLDPRLLKAYSKGIKKIQEKEGRELILDDGLLYPMPPTDTIDGYRIYIAGPSGSGKSTFATNWIRLYKKYHPACKIFLFSRDSKDESLDTIKNLKRIKIDESIIDLDIDPLKYFKNSMVVFDDIDTIKDNDIKDEVMKIRNTLLEVGRKHCISVVCTSHQICNNQPTKVVLNDSSSVVIFPKSGGSGIKYFLKTYLALDSKKIQQIMDLPSRWVLLKKDYPIMVMHERGAYFL